MSAHLTAEEKTERDELVAGLLAAAPGGLTEYELGRQVRARTGMPNAGMRGGAAAMCQGSLRRLEAAGRARCVREPWHCNGGFRRMWYPILIEEARS